ncbi:MAG: MBL fold metallo-hydrolase [Desulfobacteraceae bacterium]|nr:MBL fold metallo-hydrolase [Desulfobacteraceae bacterium]MBC2756020.1 MBL fold metallo-hydrolase [Desulfobacteraceae bacterium]
MLELIDLDIKELEYSRFISSWFYQGKEGCFLIDPGPACTINHLFAELEKRNVTHLDWILLTHIHMDHAGGIGHLVERFPDARVICHKNAVKHLKNPERLWEGSLKILGDVARVYERIKPVPSANIMTVAQVPFDNGTRLNEGIRVIPTPGHAAHHQCFVWKDVLFCGELFGIFHQLDNSIYLRPATPPVFVLDDFLRSMDAVAPYMDRRVCFSHYGTCTDGVEVMKVARQQLLLWVDVIGRHMDDPDMDQVIDDLSDKDPVFARKALLATELYKREMHFSVNSIKGILQYFSNGLT